MERDSTTMILVEVTGGGKRGIGYGDVSVAVLGAAAMGSVLAWGLKGRKNKLDLR